MKIKHKEIKNTPKQAKINSNDQDSGTGAAVGRFIEADLIKWL